LEEDKPKTTDHIADQQEGKRQLKYKKYLDGQYCYFATAATAAAVVDTVLCGGGAKEGAYCDN